MTIRIKRIYEPAAAADGLRVLVDRVWPRGVSRAEAKLSAWEKDVAPTTALRQWFGHKPARWPEFRIRYTAELKRNPAVDALRKLARGKTVTLLYGARDEDHNQAVVLAAFLGRSRRPVARAKKKAAPAKKKTASGRNKKGARA